VDGALTPGEGEEKEEALSSAQEANPHRGPQEENQQTQPSQ